MLKYDQLLVLSFMGDDQRNDFIYSGYQRKRSGLTKQQIEILTSLYTVNKKPTTCQRLQIAESLGVQEDKIKNWFQNRRAKDKKLHRESGMISGNDIGPKRHGNIYPDCNDLYRRRDS